MAVRPDGGAPAGHAEEPGEGGEHQEELELEEEAQRATTVRGPFQPTQKEVEEHELTHLPPRDWCPWCVRGRGLSAAHSRSVRPAGERTIPCVVMDYFFMGRDGSEEEERRNVPILAVRDRDTRYTFAHVVPSKGADEHTVEQVVRDLKRLGHRQLALKSDQEPAILALKEEVRRRMPDVRFLMEESPVSEHESNGAAEVCVRELEKQIRVMKAALESKLGNILDARHPILAWLITMLKFALEPTCPWIRDEGQIHNVGHGPQEGQSKLFACLLY